MTGRARKLLLAAVLLGAGLLGMYLAGDDAETGTSAGAARTSRPGAAQEEVAVADLNLERLKESRSALEAPDRNPFRFQARPAPAAAPRAAAPPGQPAPAAASPQAAVAAGPPPISLRFIGLVDAPAQGGRVAVVSDGRGNVFYGKEGDIIEGRYRVVRIGPDSMELSYLDGRGRQTIRLSGQ